MRPLAVLAVLLPLAACGGGPPTVDLPRATPRPPASDTSQPPSDAIFDDEQDYRDRREDALARLETVIGTPSARDVVSCATVPVGERACGGPAAYVVYSSETADPVEVIRVAASVTALDREANAQFGYASTCELIAEPEVVLVGGTCGIRR